MVACLGLPGLSCLILVGKPGKMGLPPWTGLVSCAALLTCYAVLCRSVICCAVLVYALLSCAVLSCAVLRCAVLDLCHSEQHCTGLHQDCHECAGRTATTHRLTYNV